MKKTKYKSIIFDLDGTLVYSDLGIMNAYKYTLNNLNLPVPTDDELKSFIGPMPISVLRDLIGVPEEKLELAYIINRGYMYTRGVDEFTVIEGMDKLVRDLYDNGYKLFIASTKIQWLCEVTLEKIGIDKCFTLISGVTNDGVTRTGKEQVVRYAIENGADEALIIGDRKYDMEAGQKCGIDTLGISFGYGGYDEVSEYNPTFVCNTVDEIRNILL